MLTATTDTVPSHRTDSGGRGVKVKAGPGRGGFWKKMAWKGAEEKQFSWGTLSALRGIS